MTAAEVAALEAEGGGARRGAPDSRRRKWRGVEAAVAALARALTEAAP